MFSFATVDSSLSNCSFASRQQANWYKAAKFCRYHGMQLASIESQQENDQLEKHIKDFGEYCFVWKLRRKGAIKPESCPDQRNSDPSALTLKMSA